MLWTDTNSPPKNRKKSKIQAVSKGLHVTPLKCCSLFLVTLSTHPKYFMKICSRVFSLGGGNKLSLIQIMTWHLTDDKSLTHWGRVTHICIGKLTIIGSDNGLSPGQRQAIIWTNAGILSTGPLGTNVGEILIEIHTFSFKNIHLKNVVWKMAAILLRPQCVNWTNDVLLAVA